MKFVTILLQFYVLGFFGHKEACGISASQPGIKPDPPALEGEVLFKKKKKLEENCFTMLLVSAVQHESATSIRISPPRGPPSPSFPPPRSSQSARPGSLCYMHLTTSHQPSIPTHGGVYMSMLLSPLVPLAPSPTSPFFTSASPFLPCK